MNVGPVMDEMTGIDTISSVLSLGVGATELPEHPQLTVEGRNDHLRYPVQEGLIAGLTALTLGRTSCFKH